MAMLLLWRLNLPGIEINPAPGQSQRTFLTREKYGCRAVWVHVGNRMPRTSVIPEGGRGGKGAGLPTEEELFPFRVVRR